jgi:hypothetical protein
MSVPSEFLSDDEVCQCCSPYVQRGAQRRFLTSRGVPFWTSPDGRPIVRRADVYERLEGRSPSHSTVERPGLGTPNPDALLRRLALRKPKRASTNGADLTEKKSHQ